MLSPSLPQGLCTCRVLGPRSSASCSLRGSSSPAGAISSDASSKRTPLSTIAPIAAQAPAPHPLQATS